MAQLHCIIGLAIMGTLVVIATGRKTAANLQPLAVNGYQSYKGGPQISSINDKENIVIKDEDDDEFNISVEKSYKEEEDLKDLSTTGHSKGHGKVKGHSKVKGHDPDDPDYQQKLIGMLVALTERVTSLQHTVTNIKLQNHYIYRSMKKGYKSCRDSPQSDTAIQTGKITDQSDTAIQTGKITDQSDTAIQTGKITDQSDTAIQTGKITDQSDTAIQTGMITDQSDTAIQTGKITDQSDTAIQTGKITDQSDTAIQTGKITEQTDNIIEATQIT